MRKRHQQKRLVEKQTFIFTPDYQRMQTVGGRRTVCRTILPTVLFVFLFDAITSIVHRMGQNPMEVVS